MRCYMEPEKARQGEHSIAPEASFDARRDGLANRAEKCAR